MAEGGFSIDTTMTFDPKQFRRACGQFATGVTVITTQANGRVHGMTANAFMSVSLEPPLVVVSVDNRSQMHQILSSVGRYGVSILAEHQEALSTHFAGRPVEGLEINFITKNSVPLVEGALAYFVVEVISVHPAGDHTLYIGQVEHFESRHDKPLLFCGGKYQRLLQDG